MILCSTFLGLGSENNRTSPESVNNDGLHQYEYHNWSTANIFVSNLTIQSNLHRCDAKNIGINNY